MPITTYANPENVTNFTSVMGYSNQVTGNIFVPVILFTFWFVLFITLKQWKNEAAFASSTFVTMLIAMFLRVMTFNGQPLISDGMVVIVLLGFMASLVFVILDRDKMG
jgi:multisubunit Na+/H+ antiporter MnhF subunit